MKPSLFITDINELIKDSTSYKNIPLSLINNHVVRLSIMTEPLYWHKLKAFAYSLRDACNITLLSRKMAVVFIPHLENTVHDLQAKDAAKALDEQFDCTNRMVNMAKIAFTKAWGFLIFLTSHKTFADKRNAI